MLATGCTIVGFLATTGAAPGTYDKVNDGVAFIASAGAEQNIGKNQMGYAAPNQAPVLLPVLPELFKATPPAQKPAAKPAGKADEKAGQKTAEKPAAEKAPEETPPAASKAADWLLARHAETDGIDERREVAA